MRLVALAVLVSVAAAVPAADTAPVTLPGAEQFDLTAKGGGEYRVFVAGPKGKAPPAGFPVIYLTDGNGNFPLLLTAVRRQSAADLAAVVVGIGYPTDDTRVHLSRRVYDLTPATDPEWLKAGAKGGPVLKAGGADAFLAFLEDEVKPAVEKRYAIDRGRQSLFGHSLGGLFALRVLCTKPTAFRTYVASSPSVWWNDRSALADGKAFAARFAGKGAAAKLLVTVGAWEQEPGPGVGKEAAAALREKRMVDDAKGVTDLLGKAGVKGLEVAYREFAEEDHGSVLLPAASRGVRFALQSP